MSDEPLNAGAVLARLAGVQAKLHVYAGRISGSLHVMRPWTHVQFRGGQDETIAQTLDRALTELQRRMTVGMPRTTQTAPCAACGQTTELRYIQSAKQWICADCRRGLRAMSDERRRRYKRAARGLS